MRHHSRPEFVIDCSITMAWCFEDEATPYSEKILHTLMTTFAIVPNVWMLEVTNVLLMAEKRKRITESRAKEFKNVLQKLPIKIDELAQSRIWDDIFELAKETKLTSYDASYLDLAIQHNLPIATLDRELKNAAKIKDVILYLL